MGRVEQGETDKTGRLTVPAVLISERHVAYIVGYGDGTFRADRFITRAEVVTIVNRLLGRVADKDYITNNLSRLNSFSDMESGHWAFYDVMEAATTHTATTNKRRAGN